MHRWDIFCFRSCKHTFNCVCFIITAIKWKYIFYPHQQTVCSLFTGLFQTHRTQKASLWSTVRLNPVWNDRNDSNTSSVRLHAVFRWSSSEGKRTFWTQTQFISSSFFFFSLQTKQLGWTRLPYCFKRWMLSFHSPHWSRPVCPTGRCQCQSLDSASKLAASGGGGL